MTLTSITANASPSRTSNPMKRTALIRFSPGPVTKSVALLAAVDSRHNGLKVFVSKEDPSDPDDFLVDHEPSLPRYRVYAGEHNILIPVPVIMWNEERDPAVHDLIINTAFGQVYLPKDTVRLKAYYNQTKMFDTADEHDWDEFPDSHVVVTRK